ncbi:MAG: hypothetical protein CVV27_20290, partial [Candidatus Melainabacteria bacterium HGW-Melainabacteria-1]
MSKERESREARIREVGQRHFELYGYKKTTIDGIVREVGIAKGTFFLHFKDKESLLIAVYQQLSQQIMTRFMQLQGEAGGSPARQLESLIRFALEQFRAYPFFLRLQQLDPEFQLFRRILDLPDSSQELDQGLAYLRGILRAGIEQGEFRPDLDIEHLPFVLGSLKFLLFYPELITANGRISTGDFSEALLQLAMNGIKQIPGSQS